MKADDRRADFLGGLFRKRQIMIPDRDLGAGGDEALGDGAAKPLRAAGDDGAAAVQIDLVHVVFLLSSVQPPSMTCATPVVNALSSLAR